MASSLEERLRDRLSSAVQQVAEEMSTQAVSGYLVKRLIVHGSFRNIFSADGTVEGFQIQLKNKLGVATIVGCTPVKIDGEKFMPEQIVIKMGRREVRASDVSENLPLSVGFGDEIMIFVEDNQGMESGKHKAELGLKMVGLGIVEAVFDETLGGEGRARIRKVGNSPGEDDFVAIMRKTVELASANIGGKKISECEKTVSAIVLDLTDYGKYTVKLSPEGEVELVEGAVSGERVLTISMTRAVFHNMAHDKMNPGMAYARGQVKLEGIPVLKLRGMDSLITAIFNGYKAASSGADFEDMKGAAGGGVLEEIFGVAFSIFDEILKTLGKALGFVGIDFFYEKALNRIEWLWDIADAEMRRIFSFGDDGARDRKTAADDSEARTAPGMDKESKPAVKTVSLRDRLKERIATVVEEAVSEISRTAVSGYLVKRLILPGSFRNFGENGEVKGFEVKLKNKLGVATVIGFSGIKIDGEEYALDQIEITKGRDKVAAAEVSDRRPLLVSFGDELLIRVLKPGGIAPGRHRVSMGVDMVGVGGVDVDYEEKLSD